MAVLQSESQKVVSTNVETSRMLKGIFPHFKAEERTSAHEGDEELAAAEKLS